MIAPAITFDPEDEDYCIVPGRGRVRRWHKVARDAGLVEPISELAYELVTNAKHPNSRCWLRTTALPRQSNVCGRLQMTWRRYPL